MGEVTIHQETLTVSVVVRCGCGVDAPVLIRGLDRPGACAACGARYVIASLEARRDQAGGLEVGLDVGRLEPASRVVPAAAMPPAGQLMRRVR